MCRAVLYNSLEIGKLDQALLSIPNNFVAFFILFSLLCTYECFCRITSCLDTKLPPKELFNKHICCRGPKYRIMTVKTAIKSIGLSQYSFLKGNLLNILDKIKFS